MKATKLVNRNTGETQWVVNGAFVTDPAVIAQIEENCAEDCLDRTPLCVESQEYTYGIDNTGTRFTDVAEYCIEWSDGTIIDFSQSGASTSWTEQLQEWAANIQAAVDDAGIVAFVEPRFIDDNNPSNIDGSTNGSPSGLPGAPSVPIAEQLAREGMSWRYVNFQICTGQPVPVRAWRKSSSLGLPVPYDLTATNSVLGPLQRFWLCAECGQLPVWYLEDGVTLAEEGQIPNCWEPCGVLALAEPPPDKSCEFFFADGCDNQNDTDPLSFIQGISRRTTVCNGQVTRIDYFQTDAADPTSVLPYELIGVFVDCASGIPVDLDLPCETSSYAGQLWRITKAERALTVDYWAPENFPTGQTSAPHGNVTDIFSLSADGRTLEHVNGAPSVTFETTNSNINTGSPAFFANVGATDRVETAGNDQLRVRGYVVLSAPALLKDTNGNTGERGGIWLNPCCAGELQLLFEDTTDSVPGDTGVFDGVVVPEGIHYVEMVTSDLSAWQGIELSASFDDGATYAPVNMYKTKPAYQCITLFRCDDTGQFINADTGEVIEIGEDDLRCAPPECGSGSGSGAGPTAQEIAAAMLTEQRTRTVGAMENFTGIAVQSLDVPAGTMGCLKTVTDYGAGVVYWTMDGSDPSATNGSTMNVQYGNFIDLCGIDLSLVRLAGSSANATYSVTYEIWE